MTLNGIPSVHGRLALSENLDHEITSKNQQQDNCRNLESNEPDSRDYGFDSVDGAFVLNVSTDISGLEYREGDKS